MEDEELQTLLVKYATQCIQELARHSYMIILLFWGVWRQGESFWKLVDEIHMHSRA